MLTSPQRDNLTVLPKIKEEQGRVQFYGVKRRTEKGAKMVKAIVVRESKYGKTKLVAESIVEGMREVSEIETALCEESSSIDLENST